jgi:hypothetical protein
VVTEADVDDGAENADCKGIISKMRLTDVYWERWGGCGAVMKSWEGGSPVLCTRRREVAVGVGCMIKACQEWPPSATHEHADSPIARARIHPQ